MTRGRSLPSCSAQANPSGKYLSNPFLVNRGFLIFPAGFQIFSTTKSDIYGI